MKQIILSLFYTGIMICTSYTLGNAHPKYQIELIQEGTAINVMIDNPTEERISFQIINAQKEVFLERVIHRQKSINMDLHFIGMTAGEYRIIIQWPNYTIYKGIYVCHNGYGHLKESCVQRNGHFCPFELKDKKIKIHYDQETKEELIVSLLDQDGNRLQEVKLYKAYDAHIIDLSAYPPGVYSVELKGEQTNIKEMLIL
ncbi:hypothetical protein [Algivirga pacifica]|uniref:Secretion system C-terminal sorting domain-containing protein n=1 Tax=Algivirga pacifica TaxID=1162670 RepID=A0ABP9DPT7_9BACT